MQGMALKVAVVEKQGLVDIPVKYVRSAVTSPSVCASRFKDRICE